MSTNESRGIAPYSTPHINMDPAQAQETWLLLKGAIREVQNENASELSFENLYRNAYILVIYSYGNILYDGVRNVVTEHLCDVSAQVEAAVNDNFLENLNEKWTKHTAAMKMIKDILMFMDRHYVVNAGVKEVYDLGLELFHEKVISSDKIKSTLSKTITDLISRERAGEVIDSSLMRNILAMLMQLGMKHDGIYKEIFEETFLLNSIKYYKVESNLFISNHNASAYLKKVETWIHNEADRVYRYMDKSTEPKLRSIIERELIFVHTETFLQMEDSGIVYMLKHNQKSDLERMYRLLSRVQGGLIVMCAALKNHLKEIGKAHVDNYDRKNPIGFVTTLLQIKDKFDILLHGPFQNDAEFLKGQNEAFEYFLNLNQSSPEFLSMYIDDILKKGSKGSNEEEVETTLDKVIQLFRFLEEKDLFERYYKQHLAKRLLNQKTASNDVEIYMITKLKSECGYQFTTKLEVMFKDIDISSELSSNFSEQNPLAYDFNVRVLAKSHWPVSTETYSLLLPQALQNTCEGFEKFYVNNHSGRKLQWNHSVSSAELKICFAPRVVRQIAMSTSQMCVFLAFTHVNKLSYEELIQTTQLEPDKLDKTLSSLSTSKYAFLIAERDSEDNFVSMTFNTKFTCKQRRLRAPAEKSRKPEHSEERKKTEDDRRQYIEAAIVRVMKTRKTSEHSQLVSEVVSQLQSRFKPSLQVIKRCIGSLIEREYIARHETNPRIYNYIT